ncbi:MAG TPA: type I-E CRISPR-associated protein Cse1/CasA [Sedimenticola thiotaurini]|uniref:Type I-E CRISPR-associated protein Cse1/CasA n=1 Tax=Sedimenticola thiotaurini TaxID=1543721 RepID=A0A831WBK0_9GAMM|nr:type I-E CRISPR-associated protein Cse1/CasA [Sedimenticola thiotaurini]
MNLLTDPLLRVETPDGIERLSLPGLLAALGQDRVESLPGIQRHQEDAFHVFLCQLASVILARDGRDDPVQSEDYWREGLRRLAGEAGDDAWTLVVEDLSKPAFMQPPCEGTKFSMSSISPDAFDTTEVSKNHDLKMARGMQPECDLWAYALVSSNATAGYSIGGSGRFYFATIKAKKNRVGRVYVRPTVTGSIGQQWQFDITCLLHYRPKVLNSEYGYSKDGVVLTWASKPHHGQQLQLNELDPFFIEITRQYRLFSTDQSIEGRSAPSVKPFIYSPKALSGNVGDPYAPVDANDSSVISVSNRGWSAERLRSIVFKESINTPLLPIAESLAKEGLLLRCSSVARSAKGTEGYQSRELLIPKPVMALFRRSKTDVDPIADMSKAAIAEVAGKMERVLATALLAYLHVSDAFRDQKTKRLDWTDKEWRAKANKKHGAWLNRNAGPMTSFGQLWAEAYFPWLWQSIEGGELTSEEDRRRALENWARYLRDEALRILERSLDELPVHTGRQWLARTEAVRVFKQMFYSKHNFPHLKEESHAQLASH